MDPNGTARLHLEAEATKLAYDARNRFLADMDHVSRLDHMLAPETARQLASLIDTTRAMQAPAPLTEDVHKDTIMILVYSDNFLRSAFRNSYLSSFLQI